MHELSMAQEMLNILEEQVKTHKVKKVHRVSLRVGKMMSVVPSSLIFCFEILSKGTSLEGAKLEIEEVPVKCRCKDCGEEFIVESLSFFCPECKGINLEHLSGHEFLIHHLEVD
ncbi:MAG: hydrogenase maturation nickel metallochaperone HypA [bacterium]